MKADVHDQITHSKQP